ncbi:MAG: choice-of-anchor D domain-containing protein, partial [Polyangiaceae bacterium]
GLLTLLPALGGCFGSSSNNGGGSDGGLSSLEASLLDVTGSSTVTITSGSVLDFGLAECGGKAPAPTTFTLRNSGATAVQYSLSLSSTSVFQIASGGAGTVAAGATASVTITATAVAASATAGQVDQATLGVTTSDPSLPTAQVTLKRTAEGATLTLSPAMAAMGDVAVGSTSPALPLTLTNTGNEAASVTISAPTSPLFGVTWTGTAGAPVSLAPKASVPMLGATFSPTATGPASAMSALAVTGAVCAGSVTSIPMTGNGTIAVVDVTPGMLDFQSVDCGQSGTPQTVTVSNTGTGPLTFNAALLAGTSSPFAVAPKTGTVAAGQSTILTVTPAPIPAVASIAPNAFGDTLQITTNVPGDGNHDVTLTETAQGAVLALDTSTISFGNVNLNQTSSSPFNITNSGTAPATVTLGVTGAPPYGVSPTTPTTLTVGGSPLTGAATLTPTTLGMQPQGSITIATGPTDVVCSAPLGPISLNGTGATGTMSLSTTAIDFQSVPCLSTAAPQTFTITNSGAGTLTWSATLGLGASSPYQLSPSSGTIAAGAMPVTVKVTPAMIPFPSALTANLYGDTITVTPGMGAAQTIAVTESAEGGVLTVTPSPLPAFANQQEGQASAAATLTITNSGNMPVTLTTTIGGTNASSFSLTTPGPTTLAANGGKVSPGPKFAPQATGALTGQINLALGPTDAVCQVMPGPIPLSGTGVNGAITLGSNAVSIAAQPCGSTTALTSTLLLTNNGTASLTWNAAVTAGGFTVAPKTGTLAAGGGNVTLTVTGPTFTATNGNITPVTGNLQVTTSAFGDTAHNVALSSTPSGAILAWGAGLTGFAFGDVQATPGGTKGRNLPLSVTNSGNAAATVGFALAGTSTFTFSPQNSSVAGPGTLSGNATFDPTTSSGQSDTVKITVPNGTTLCAGLPAGLSITGTGAQGTYTNSSTGLDFTMTCNATAAAQTFTINNTPDPGAVPYDFTATVTAGWTVSPASGTVQPSTPFTITVTPPAQGPAKPAGSNNATVAITTDIPGDVVHDLAVDGTITGDTFTFLSATGAAQPTLSWGSPEDGTGPETTYLSGVGNSTTVTGVTVQVTAGTNNLAGATLLINGAAASSWKGTSGSNTVTYTLDPPTNCPCGAIFTYTVTVPTTTPGVCGGTTQTLTILEGNSC